MMMMMMMTMMIMMMMMMYTHAQAVHTGALLLRAQFRWVTLNSSVWTPRIGLAGGPRADLQSRSGV